MVLNLQLKYPYKIVFPKKINYYIPNSQKNHKFIVSLILLSYAKDG